MAKLDTIAAAYAVVFGRAADGDGLKYWENQAKSMTDAQFVNYFIDTDAGKAEMKNNGIGSNKDYQSFVEVLYKWIM